MFSINVFNNRCFSLLQAQNPTTYKFKPLMLTSLLVPACALEDKTTTVRPSRLATVCLCEDLCICELSVALNECELIGVLEETWKRGKKNIPEAKICLLWQWYLV